MKLHLTSLFIAFSISLTIAQVPRLSLYESFTGENCWPCAMYNPTVDAIMESPNNTDKVVCIKWMVPIISAPSNTWSLYQTNKAEINWRFSPSPAGYGYKTQNTSTTTVTNGINMAPTAQLDGQDLWQFGTTNNHPGSLNDAAITNAHGFTSPFSVTMAKAWNQNMSALNITVNIVASQNFEATGFLIFRTVMIEKVVQFTVDPYGNGEYTFKNPVIASFPTLSTGQAMPESWLTGQSQTFTLSCVVPPHCRDINEVDLVGFIQDDGNQKVEQTVRASDCVHTPLTLSAPQFICSGETATLTASGSSSYSWSTGQTGSSIVVPFAELNYWVKSTDATACPNIAAIATKTSACTGITSQVKTPDIHIYPNPSKGEFMVKGNFENSVIMIYDLVGKKVFEQKLNSEETQIKTNLSRGVYTYSIIQSSSSVVSDKLIIE